MAEKAISTPYFNYDALCKTEVNESDKFKFVWVISKFSSRTEENGVYIKSEQFTIKGPGTKTTKWFVKMYPSGDNSESSDYVSVFLFNNNNEGVNTKCAFFSIDSCGKQRIIQEFSASKIPSRKDWGFPKFLKKDILVAHYTPEDTFTLLLEITVIGETKYLTETVANSGTLKNLQNDSNLQLSRDLGLLYETKEYADVSITCRGKKFECHKNILASRSPVFKTMLDSDMKERHTGNVVIKDMDPEVLANLLSYIYTGSAPDIETMAKELFTAADQYQLMKLKELCEVKLSSSIKVNNCIELLVLGDLHQASTLRKSALKFVSQNLDKINTEYWQKALTTYPSLFAEVVSLMIPKKNDGGEKN